MTQSLLPTGVESRLFLSLVIDWTDLLLSVR